MNDSIRLMAADVASGNYPNHVRQNSKEMPFELIFAENEDEESLIAAAAGTEAILLL